MRNKLAPYSSEIIDSYVSEGIGSHLLAKRYDTTARTSLDLLKKNGVEVKTIPRNKLDSHKTELVQLYEAGVNSVILADKFGASPMTIRKTIRKQGIEIRPKGKQRNFQPDKETMDEVVRLYEAGATLKILAVRFKATSAQIAEIVKEHGVSMHKGKRPSPSQLRIKQALIESYKAGIPIPTIAKALGLKYNTAYVTLYRNGLI